MKDTAYFCPNCGSPTIQRSSLAGGNASCDSCQWTGTSTDLHKVDFEHDFSSPDQVIERFAAEFKGVIGQHLALPLGSMLLKWGFLERDHLAADLGIYMRAIAAAAAKAIFETRQGIATGAIERPARKPPAVPVKGVH